MPSFTLVLTTGHQSHRRHPSTLTFNTLSSAPDRLMVYIKNYVHFCMLMINVLQKTIDLRDQLEDDDNGLYTDVSVSSGSH
jgi:hypothetical protein